MASYLSLQLKLHHERNRHSTRPVLVVGQLQLAYDDDDNDDVSHFSNGMQVTRQ